jgi:type VI secretion system protein ImpA
MDASTSIAYPTGEATITIAKKGPLSNREEALKRLAEVAEYFHTHEPQSPVAYLVERAIKWGKMPLEAWLEDVIKNDNVMDHLRETLGFKTVASGAASGSESKQS